MGRRAKTTGPPGFHIIVSFGCSRRPLQRGRYHDYLLANGWRPVDSVQEADLILIYTCGGFQETEDRGLATIARVRKVKRKSARLVITGCLLKIHPAALGSDPDLIPPEKLEALDDIISARVPLAEIPEPHTPPPLFDFDPPSRFRRLRDSLRFSPEFLLRGLRTGIRLFQRRNLPQAMPEKRWYLRIARGCIGRCSYCAIKIACGRLRSRPPEVVLEEFRRGREKGFRDFVILAEDTGCYGLDIGTDITSLLEEITAEPGDYRLIIKDFNPGRLIRDRERLISLFERRRDRLRDIRMPIQSGSDRILARMRRPYRIDAIRDALRELWERVPGFPVFTHFIVGFPGETAEDFSATEALMREFDFADTQIYIYEARPGTEASGFENQVPARVKRDRKRRLERMREARKRSRIPSSTPLEQTAKLE